MGLIVNRVVKLVGSSIGLGREAYLHHKETKALSQQSSTDAVAGPSSRSPPAYEDVYVELPNEDAKELVSRGEAVDVTDEKEAQRALRRIDSESSLSSLEEDDEQDWALDEAASPPPYSQSEPEQNRSASVGTLVREVIPDATAPFSTARLPYPVIVPQRRPGTKTRGFVRAYAPDLGPCGIDQDTFLRFIQNFHEASQASPILKAIYVSAGIAGFAPSIIATAVCISVQVAAGTAIEVQSRYRTNAYLDEINKDLFMPRGLYAMVIKYKPGVDIPGMTEVGVETIDMLTTKAVAKYAPIDGTPAPRNFKAKLKPIRLFSGVSSGEGGMPTTCAPLVFPALDALPSPSPSSEHSGQVSPAPSGGFKNKSKRAGDFVQDYFDRRAQATYISENPSTTLATAGVTPTFRSRFSDPNHPANSGHIVNLITGGKVQMEKFSREDGLMRRAERKEFKDLRRVARGREPRGPRGQRPKGPIGMVVGGVKKMLKPDVLYLIIVSMPSESELTEARQALEIS